MMKLIRNLRDGIVRLEEPRVRTLLDDALSRKIEISRIVEAVRDALTEVGELYEEKKYFLSDLILAAGISEYVFERITPLLSGKPAVKGKVILGTVQGSLHGMGKSILAAMLRAEGYEVHDLGVDVPAERFVDKVRETSASVLGLSVGLVQAIPSIGEVVEALKQAGLRDRVNIIVGGNAATLERVLELGCDAYAPSAVAGLKKIGEWASSSAAVKQPESKRIL